VLTASVSMAGMLGSQTQHPRPGEAPDRWVSLRGLTSRSQEHTDEHLRWLQQYDLKVGDRITIEIVETTTPSSPVSRKSARESA